MLSVGVKAGGEGDGVGAAAASAASSHPLPSSKHGKVAAALELKAKGNGQFAKGEFKKARRSYRKAFLYLDGLQLPHSGEQKVQLVHGLMDGGAGPELGAAYSEEMKLGGEALEARIKVRCNLAKCELKLGRAERAVQEAKKAVQAAVAQIEAPRQTGPEHALMWAKAYFVLATATLALGDSAAAKGALASADEHALGVAALVGGEGEAAATSGDKAETDEGSSGSMKSRGSDGGARGEGEKSGGVGSNRGGGGGGGGGIVSDAAALDAVLKKAKALRRQVRALLKKAKAEEKAQRKEADEKWKAAMNGGGQGKV